MAMNQTEGKAVQSESERIGYRLEGIRTNMKDIQSRISQLRIKTFGAYPEKDPEEANKMVTGGFIVSIYTQLDQTDNSINKILTDLSVMESLY